VPHTPLTDDVSAWIQAFAAALWLAYITLDEIRQAKAADDSLRPITQLLKDQAKPPKGSLHQYPEDTRVLLSQ